MDRRKFLKFGLASGATLVMTPALLEAFKPPKEMKGITEAGTCIDGVYIEQGDQMLVTGSAGNNGIYTCIQWEESVEGPWALPNDELGVARFVSNDRVFIMGQDGWVEYKGF